MDAIGAIGGFATLLLIGLALLGVWYRRHRDARTAVLWEQVCHRGRGELAYVARVYQNARRGSKAIIVWHKTGLRQDTWFEGRQARPGTYLLLSGQSGYGPHNHNPNVFYVEYSSVAAALPGNAEAAHRRHSKRLARANAKNNR